MNELFRKVIGVRIGSLMLSCFENKDIEIIRYYRGRHKIAIIEKKGKKAIIQHLEKGYVGNNSEGYKEVDFFQFDITLLRNCYKKKLV